MLNEVIYTYTFAESNNDLENYIAIRNKIYKKLNGESVDIVKDSYDKADDILIIKKNGNVIGGTRISCVEPGAVDKLPLEALGFDLTDMLPNVLNSRRCEVGRSCLTPGEVSSKQVFAKSTAIIIKEAIARNCDYLFFVTPVPLVNHFCALITQLGLTIVNTLSTINLNFKDKKITLCLCYVNLKKEKLSLNLEKTSTVCEIA